MMNNESLRQELTKACKRIAPAWPLKNSVAVNPYLGLTDLNFHEATKLLSERSEIEVCMPISFYLESFDKQEIRAVDIRSALDKSGKNDLTTYDFIKEVRFLTTTSTIYDTFKVKTVLDAAESVTGKHWNDFMIDTISSWASSYFDESQTLWNTTSDSADIFQSWKQDAEIDRSTELMGIKNFRTTLNQLPDNAAEAATIVLERLEIPEELIETYVHTLLLKIVGWSSYVGGLDWNNALYTGESENLQSFLSVLLAWELCAFESFKAKGIQETWNAYKADLRSYTKEIENDDSLEARLLLQDAYDFATQRHLEEKFNTHQAINTTKERPIAQAVFCIDVRSEVYRRRLENVNPQIETVGFAGFFGFPINYVPLAHGEGKNQCPVLIPSGPVVKETFAENSDDARKTRAVKHQVEKTWKSFKSGAISSFGFVSPLGLSYLPKLISDSFGWTRPIEDPNKDGLGKWIKNGRELDLSEIKLEDKISMAAGALTAMGLKDKMAPLVLITGHGSTSVNNPHATGLDCGACGGHSGEINAMTAERILNDKEVRKGLAKQGVSIPFDTHFIACLHDTTTDEIHLIGESNIPNAYAEIVVEIKQSLKLASIAAREERSKRLNVDASDIDTSMLQRSKDWSQVRPEWGLAGCSSFIIAPRKRSTGLDLGGKAFLHSYDWKSDEEFSILEAIMTAPMVVTSWINLQYFASTTDNKHFGAGNKTLHNVTGGIGVLEGSAGDLRIGLAMQSVHDGREFQHLPQRLNVVIEAPMNAINEILEKNDSIKQLCDNAWITLLNMDENGKIKHRYTADFNWEEVSPEESKQENKQLVTI